MVAVAVHERPQAEGLSAQRGVGSAAAAGATAGGRVAASSERAPGGRERELAALERRIVACRACPRLVEWRERVGREKRRAFAREEYWARPVPGFGDPAARVYVLGLAPAAHGANRTGRVFTGDRSADWLYASLHRTGFANQPISVSVDDGLELQDAWVGAAVRCAPPANKPLPAERDNCLPYLAEELALLDRVRVIVCLGRFGWDAAVRVLGLRPAPRFGHGAEHVIVAGHPSAAGRSSAGGVTLLASYHPSPQNTFTGKLTEPMTDAIFLRARELISSYREGGAQHAG